MDALLVDRGTAADTIFTLMGASLIKIEGNADRLILTPASAEANERNPEYIDPADYPNTTAYLNAIPGMVESILEASNAPMSEFVDVPDEWIDRNV